MSFFRRMFFFLILNFFVVLMASAVGGAIIHFLGIQGEWGMYIVFYSLIGFGGAFISLWMSKWMAKKFMGARVIDPRTKAGGEKELVEMTHNLARKARLPQMPEVAIFESPMVNAFATGRSRSNSLVAVSTGALRKMSREELDGVLGHEVAHIANGDMVTMTLLTGLMNTMVLLAARFVSQIIVSKMKSRSFWMEYSIFIGLQMVFGALAMIVLNAFSRKREYRADEGGAKLAGAGNMIKALEALKRAYSPSMLKAAAASRGGGRGTQESMQYLQISGRQKASLFSTHPPLDSRIQRLKRRFG